MAPPTGSVVSPAGFEKATPWTGSFLPLLGIVFWRSGQGFEDDAKSVIMASGSALWLVMDSIVA